MMKYSTVAINVLIFYFLGPLSTHIATSNNLHPGTLHGHHSSRNYDLNEATPYEADDNIEGPISSKRYLESIASDIFKRDYNSRVIDPVSSDIFNKETEKRLIESIGTDIFKKSSPYQYYHSDQHPYGSNSQKLEYLQRPGDSLQNVIAHRKLNLNFREGSRKDKVLKFNDTFDKTIPHGHKRFLESIASDIFKKDSAFDKRFLDEIASSLVKRDYDIDPEIDLYSVAKEENSELTNKRNIDEIASSLIKKDDGEKRYFDGIASSLVKKDDGEKRHLDGIASSLIKKDDGEKRHLDGIASSLIKKDDGEKRHLDGIASSLIKKDDGEKRHLDGIASSLIKKDDGEKRHLDGIASSLIKKDDVEKRYFDGIASSLVKKDDGEKRYFDGIASSLVKKDDGEKRYFDGIASSLVKKDDGEKRYFDGIASSLVKKDDKRYFDGIASSLVKKDDGEKRYFDGIASSLVKKDDKRYFDGIASSLVKKDDGEKRYFDGIASSLVKKDDKRYFDGIASSLVKKDDGEKRYFEDIASSLIKRSSNSATHSKRMYEVTDDVLDGSRISKRTADGVRGWRESEKKETDDTAPKLRHRRDVSLISVPRVSLSRPRRFIDSTGSDIFKRQPFRLFTKAHVDPQTWHSWGTYKPQWQKTKSNEGAAKSFRLLGKRDWLDHLGEVEDAKMDDAVSRLYLDQHEYNKRHLDSIASSLLQKRYLDTLASSLIKRSDTDEQGFADGYFTLPLSREIYFRQPLDVLDNDQERFEF
ncbi:uncharacterized protein LOC129923135 [Biomphalaria glabrata]|uniref:Uncharacterized protein LOC129923135 n=1 Tax=Biomphalaria glabrata TaxID=6526 RepID=A0A9W2Z1P3_BIOGL|nr:uncharacterized protein LOC129923135 [Biomphalaria glabrata]